MDGVGVEVIGYKPKSNSSKIELVIQIGFELRSNWIRIKFFEKSNFQINWIRLLVIGSRNTK